MTAILIAEGVIVYYNDLPMPALLFGGIALVSFLVLGAITWSYRDVANRNSHKTSGSKAGH